jgi:transcriptional regulator
MRENPDYAFDEHTELRAFIARHPWMTMVSHVPGRGLVASHYPVIIDEEAEGLVLLSHVGRPDERAHDLGTHEIMLVAYGPQGYVSPSWYGTSPAVPTWNFEVAHLYGTPELLSGHENLAVLERLVARFENVLPEPFLMNRTLENSDYAARIVHGTVGFRLPVTRVEAKTKMSQDKSEASVASVIDALRAPGPYRNEALADRMSELHGRTQKEDR